MICINGDPIYFFNTHIPICFIPVEDCKKMANKLIKGGGRAGREEERQFLLKWRTVDQRAGSCINLIVAPIVVLRLQSACIQLLSSAQSVVYNDYFLSDYNIPKKTWVGMETRIDTQKRK